MSRSFSFHSVFRYWIGFSRSQNSRILRAEGEPSATSSQTRRHVLPSDALDVEAVDDVDAFRPDPPLRRRQLDPKAFERFDDGPARCVREDRRDEDPFALAGGPAGVRDAPGEQGDEREREKRGEEDEAFHCRQGRVNPCLRRFRGL